MIPVNTFDITIDIDTDAEVTGGIPRGLDEAHFEQHLLGAADHERVGHGSRRHLLRDCHRSRQRNRIAHGSGEKDLALDRRNRNIAVGNELSHAAHQIAQVVGYLNADHAQHPLVGANQGNICDASRLAEHVKLLVRDGHNISDRRIGDKNLNEFSVARDGAGPVHRKLQFNGRAVLIAELKKRLLQMLFVHILFVGRCWRSHDGNSKCRCDPYASKRETTAYSS